MSSIETERLVDGQRAVIVVHDHPPVSAGETRPQTPARTVISMDFFAGVIFSMTPASSTMPVNIKLEFKL